MTDGDTITQVAVVILLLGMAVPTLGTAHTYAGTPFEYEESVTVDYDSDTQVAQNATDAEGYSETVNITVDSTTLESGTDYRWDADNGTIDWLNSSSTNDGDSGQIEYEAYQRTEQTGMAWLIISPLMGLFGLFGLVASVRALWSYSAEVWDLT